MLFNDCHHGAVVNASAATNGRYAMTFMSTRAGRYRIFISIDGSQIQGSPYSDLEIVANDVNISNSIAVGIRPAYADDWYTNDIGLMIPLAPHFAAVVRDDLAISDILDQHSDRASELNGSALRRVRMQTTAQQI